MEFEKRFVGEAVYRKMQIDDDRVKNEEIKRNRIKS